MHGKQIVISGINLTEGGPLSIYYDCLDAMFECELEKNNHITAFVHKKSLFLKYKNKIEIIEVPKSKRNYLFRLFYEYMYFYFYSYKHKIDFWLSLHDITPNVHADKIYTYCHNPSPFYKPSTIDWRYSKTVCLFSYFYRFIYRINIRKCTSVIVQQDWIRKEFIKHYGIKNVIVARPKLDTNIVSAVSHETAKVRSYNDAFTFIVASFPRTFKNFEVVCEACKLLNEEGISGYNVLMTLNGNENAYSKYLYDKYSSVKNITWLGLLNRSDLFKLYSNTDCMIFPSKLETWGLPISEYKDTGNPIIVSDLPYAHETVGSYEKVAFFNPYEAEGLSIIMKKAITGEKYYSKAIELKVQKAFAENWYELCKLVFTD